jgi:hypothetical protein
VATVSRGKLLSALHKEKLSIPATPQKWAVDCKHVGHGLPALKYLSRYLYRGVISTLVRNRFPPNLLCILSRFAERHINPAAVGIQLGRIRVVCRGRISGL